MGVYSRPLVSEQGQELGHSVILVHLDSRRKPRTKAEILSSFSEQSVRNNKIMAKLGISQHLRIQYTEIWSSYLKEIKRELPGIDC